MVPVVAVRLGKNHRIGDSGNGANIQFQESNDLFHTVTTQVSQAVKIEKRERGTSPRSLGSRRLSMNTDP